MSSCEVPNFVSVFMYDMCPIFGTDFHKSPQHQISQ